MAFIFRRWQGTEWFRHATTFRRAAMQLSKPPPIYETPLSLLWMINFSVFWFVAHDSGGYALEETRRRVGQTGHDREVHSQRRAETENAGRGGEELTRERTRIMNTCSAIQILVVHESVAFIP
ncbi:uncharacterized protein LOC124671001 [Lolium rigidum]|uniref:uncharacterized protein LOC124671001 n=1 Tax=Lolium rigidum TaxID=89674 RepID=UPI001F5C4A71|nr:uncharacterized protein LOC124671001 [Lolium rigidum]